jgi:hypothetical protein
VTPAEAAALLRLLRAAYPDAKRRVGQDTTDLWLEALRRLDPALGETAVRSLISSARRWPSLAELEEQVEVARRQAAQARRDRERQQAEQAAEQLPRPPLEAIPEVQALLDGWSESFGLTATEDGRCDQCGRQAARRFLLGRVALCRDCTRSRKAGAIVAGAARGRDRVAASGGPRRRDQAARDGRPPREPQRTTTCRLCAEQLRPARGAGGRLRRLPSDPQQRPDVP